MSRRIPAILVVAFLAGGGCDHRPKDRPELGLVTGTVTLDGDPLPDADIIFTPEAGRPSGGITDGDGKYEMFYIGSTPGAKLGSHKVRITTVRKEIPPDDDPTYKPPEEIVPPQYNIQTTLDADVGEGRNVLDFELSSK